MKLVRYTLVPRLIKKTEILQRNFSTKCLPNNGVEKPKGKQFRMLEKISSKSGKDKRINFLIKFINEIPKYTQVENSVVKFKLNLKHFLITETFYNITKFFLKLQNFEFEEK